MLVLHAKIGEAIWVGEVKVVVLATQADKLKLGFDGPRNVEIWRDKLVQKGTKR